MRAESVSPASAESLNIPLATLQIRVLLTNILLSAAISNLQFQI